MPLGLYEPAPEAERERCRQAQHGETLNVDLLHRAAPIVQMHEGLRALSKDRPISPASVAPFLRNKFGDRLEDAKAAMARLAPSATRHRLESLCALRGIPPIDTGEASIQRWAAIGSLNLDRIVRLAV